MKMTKLRFTKFLLGAMVLFGLPAKAEETVDYQKRADRRGWGWKEEMANPFSCIFQSGRKYDIQILVPKGRDALTIAVLLDGREVHAWEGHWRSVFRILDDRLYYARFHPSSSGGSIVAVDLSTGKELWTSELKALGSPPHFYYSNILNLDCNQDVVTVYGNETFGGYYEVKRADTGETVGHKVFENTETDTVLRSVREAVKQFFAACENGDLERVKQLVSAGMDVRQTYPDVFYNHRRRGALHYAAKAGHAELIQYLLDSGCDPNARDKEGVSPLHLAMGEEKAVEVLLAGKADPDAKDDSGRTPLHYAARDNRSGAAQALLQHGAKVDMAYNLGFTPLHAAAESGATEVVEVLLKAGAQPLAKDTHGQTPLSWAQARKHTEIIQKLEEAVEQSPVRAPDGLTISAQGAEVEAK